MSYLFAVQDEAGREVCSARFVLDELTPYRDDDRVELHGPEGCVAVGTYSGGGALSLLRWPADDKLSAPVVSEVR